MYLLVVLILILCNPAWAEANDIEILEQSLHQIEDDTKKIDALISLTQHYIYIEPKKSAQFSSQAISLLERSNDKNRLADMLRMLGLAETFQGLTQSAFVHLTKAIKVAKQTNNAHLISVTNRAMGVFFELIIDYDQAMEYYVVALNFAQNSDQPEDLAMVYNNIGNVLNAQGTFVEASDYFVKSIAIYKTVNNIELQMNATVGLGTSYLKSGSLDEARQTLETVTQVESVKGGFTYSEAMVNLAHVSRLKGEYEQAINEYLFVLNDEQGSRYPPAVAAAYLGLAQCYELTGQLELARQIYKKGLMEIKDKTSVESEMELYEQYAALELKEGRYEQAALIQSQYIERRDEIQPLRQQGIVTKLEAQLVLERDVSKLQIQLLESEREASKASFYLLGVVIFAVFSLMLIMILYLRKKAYLRLEQNNRLLESASKTDPLTGVGNRRYLEANMDKLQATSHSMAFLLLDIDFFKTVNDNYGHAIGDKLLIQITQAIQPLCGKREDACLFARIGGEEFVIVTDCEKRDALLLAEQVRKSVECMPSEIDEPVTVSIGVSACHIDDINYDRLYKEADIALYRAKKEGRNKVWVYGQ